MAAETTIVRENRVNAINAERRRSGSRRILPFDAATTSTENLRFYRQLAIRDFNEATARNGWSDDFYNTTKARVDAIDKELKRRGG